MPIIMKNITTLSGNYTEDQQNILLGYIDLFRGCIADSDPSKNIIIGKTSTYTDNEVIFFFNRALKDLNTGIPRTNYTLFNFPDDDLMTSGAMVFALIKEGLLQLKNNVDYSDSGLSINLFNKSSQYQGWVGFLMQDYMSDKAIFKSGVLPSSPNSGFVGIGSEFGYSNNGWW